MIKIYDLENNFITEVDARESLNEFMSDNEFEYPKVLIEEGEVTSIYTFEDSEYENNKKDLLKKSEYFHMDKICALANVDYYAFNLWRNKGIFTLTNQEIDDLLHAMDFVAR